MEGIEKPQANDIAALMFTLIVFLLHSLPVIVEEFSTVYPSPTILSILGL